MVKNNKETQDDFGGDYKMDEYLINKIKLENIKVHKKEATIYDTIHSEIFNFYEQKRVIQDIDFITKQLNKRNPYVLDIGCGTGNLSLKFLEKGFRVTGVDISKQMLDMLRGKNQSDSLELIESDVDAFISNETKKYDVISFSSVLHHLPSYMETIKNTVNLLNKGAFIYIIHEPLPRSEQSLIWRIISTIDSLLFYRFILKIKGIKMPKISYVYSDYHAEKGLSFDKIVEYLISEGYEILKFEKYNARKISIFSALENKLNPNKQCFKLILKRMDFY